MVGTVHTGLTLDSRKQTTRQLAISTAPLADELILALDQHSRMTLQPCVQVGDPVQLGQIIATPDTAGHGSLGAYLHAPVSGQVLAIEPRPSLHNSLALSMVLRNDHQDTRHATCQPYGDWSALSARELCAQLARGGLVGLGGAAFPTATKLSTQQRHTIDTLIINGVECEPYITCDDRLMRERADRILQGILILLHAAQATRCIIAIEIDKPEATQALRSAMQALNDIRIGIQNVPAAYPSGDEGQLIQRLLQKEVPQHGLPADIGVIVHNVATAYACARWILDGEPLISRITTLTGQAIAVPGNIEVRIGTPIYFLLATYGLNASHERIIMGGAMMGKTLHNTTAPITKSSNCIIVAATHELSATQPEQACIRCGECMQACPVGLLPQQLLLHTQHQNHFALQQLALQDCIECACCDYVCPSQIRLSSRFHAAKRHLTTPA